MTRQSPNNVVWDLTKPLGTPTSHLADHARVGKTITGRESRPVEATEEKSVDDKAPIATPKPTQKAKVPSLGGKRPPELPDELQINEGVAGKTKGGWLIPAISALGLLAVATGCAVMFVPGLQERTGR